MAHQIDSKPKEKEPLAVTILRQAYRNPKWGRIKFADRTLECGNCGNEFVTIVETNQWRRHIWCNYCGVTFKENRGVAA